MTTKKGNKVRTHEAFDQWIVRLRKKDRQAANKVLTKIALFENGNFGDHKSVGQGVMEARLHFGPGYRVYYMKIGDVVYVLLRGGTKASQSKDIVKAIELSKEIQGDSI